MSQVVVDPMQSDLPLSHRQSAAPPFGRRDGPVPTPVFDSYWRFAAERQEVFFRRASGDPGPWTDDPVIGRFRFTNAYRASDRVSQYLIRNVIYDADRDFRETFLRVVLFKIFNRTETWKLLEDSVGTISTASFNVSRLDGVLESAMERGSRIYSAAYIMPSGNQRGVRKHRFHLELLDRMLSERLPERIAASRSMADAYGLLLEYPSVGPFLAYQWITDLNYSPHLGFDEMEFVVPGPGARDGLRKCFSDPGSWSEADIIRLVAESQADEFARRGIRFRSLWGRPLQLIDCQNLLCEVDKYARAVHPEYSGKSGRSRIKQRFAPTSSPIDYWFPPKWEIDALAGG